MSATRTSELELEKGMPGKRNNKGSLAEFGPAMVVFVIFVLIPILDLGVLPIRYGLAYNELNEFVHRIAMAEKMSDAIQMIVTESKMPNSLKAFGVVVAKTKLSLRVVNKSNQVTVRSVPEPNLVPKQWQPDGKDGPFVYQLELATDLKISPLFLVSLPWKGIPGLTSPWSATIVTTSAWENVGRDSNAPPQKDGDYPYYMNE
ncbi:MAG TPA: hypothetical protein V6C76_12935 [Drouetiella sp.]